MRRLGTRAAWAVGLVATALVSCTPGPPRQGPPRPHPDFPIGDGAAHALGHATEAGAVQCTSCHALTNTNFAQFSCLGCHDHAQERLDPRHASAPGYRYESAACYACHRDGTAANAPHAPLAASDPTQDLHLTTRVPTFSGPTIVSTSPLEQALPMTMQHASAQVPEAAFSSCSTCHPSADVKAFYPGQFHASLLALKLPPPGTCSDCHAATQPVGFVGPVVSSRTPATGEMRHDAVAWANGAPTATALVTQDCASCHVSPTSSAAALWSTGARFHAALSAQPTSCLDCHANSRPGALSSTNASLPAGVTIDHSGVTWLGDCVTCHAPGSWAGGKFHLAGATAPKSCLPCHAQERPTSTAGWTSPTFTSAPFDSVAADGGVSHGAGQDCAMCHADPSAAWVGGHFAHGAGTPSSVTCVACHATQRPTSAVSGFDHATSGTGDCFGCHQTTSSFASLGDWAGGVQYPGANLISSTDQFITVPELTLKRGASGLVTGTSTVQATLFNAMLHTSATLPSALAAGPSPGNAATCWHCHASAPGTTTVTSFAGGQFHASLTAFRVDLDAGVTPLAQPTTGCTDCHSNMRPAGVVQRGDLRAMDHDAGFSAAVDVGGVQVTTVAQLDCSLCHASPGATWSDGAFHTQLPAQAKLADCSACHFPLMADAAKADVTTPGTPKQQMKHRSAEVPTQACDRCHASALANAPLGADAGAWAPGVMHAALTAQPSACVDCHAITAPAQPRQSSVAYDADRQWMNHAVAAVAAKDCATCHAPDAAAGSWSSSTALHRAGLALGACGACHGPANGGSASNVPPGLVTTATVTSASAATGVAGAFDQLSHADVNVSGHDCGFCHVQVGPADAGSPVAGHEWEQATFHAHFTGSAALVLNGSTGRCSACHLNVKPTAAFTAQDHSAFTATSTDCSACHQWPGAGTQASPTWQRPSVASPPPTISVGGFSVAQPPASSATTQAGLNGLAHPAIPAGASCTTCHGSASGGRGAFGYDHALAPATGCAACHEAGSDLVGTPWSSSTSSAVQRSAQCAQGGGTVADRGGDTRPIGLASLACSASAASLTCGAGTCVQNHFYPSDCGECHARPTATPATVQTGSGFVGSWGFQHYFGAPAQQATCCHCHSPPGCRG